MISWPLHAARYDSLVRSIDKQVFQTDKELDTFTKTSVDTCEEDSCTRTVSYWDAKGRIRKVAEEMRTRAGPGTVTGRYYADCKIYFARVTPNDTEKVKSLKSIEKFYYHGDTLVRVMVGDETQSFGPEQMKSYQIAQRIQPAACTHDIKSDLLP